MQKGFSSRNRLRLMLAGLVAGVLVVESVVLLAVLVILSRAGAQQLHHAPVVVVAPGVVGEALADETNQLSGQPLDTRSATSATDGRDRVRSGRSAAAVVVDLRDTHDLLIIDGARPQSVRTALVRQVRELEQARGRTVEVMVIRPRAPSEHLRFIVVVTTTAGYLAALVLGAFSSASPRGRGRWLPTAGATTLCAMAVGAAAVVLEGGARPTGVLAVAAGTLLAFMIARALDLLAGPRIAILGLSTHAVLLLPLVRGVDIPLLPEPWAEVLRGMPSWATYELLVAVVNHRSYGLLVPAAVLATWSLAAGVALLVGRQHPQQGRRTAETPHDQAESGRGFFTTASDEDPASAMWALRWRARTFGVLTISLIAALSAVFVAPVPGETTQDVADLASTTACIASGQVDSLKDLNRVSAQVRGDPSFQGGDVGADVKLQDGRRLMVFGDTLRGNDFDGQRFVRNSMLVFGQDCIQTVLPSSGGALMPDRAGSGSRAPVGYWPMSIRRVGRPGYDLVAVFAQRVRTTGSGIFDFENLGPAVAVFVVPRAGTPQLVAVRDIGPDDADVTRPEWGAATATSGGWLYIYGTSRPNEKGVFGMALRVARVRPDDVLDTSRWRYWDGRDWQPEPAKALELIPAVRGVSQTLSVFESQGHWYALSKRDDFLGTDLTVWRAEHPWGPFDSGTKIGQLPSDAATGELRYMPLAHPDLLPRPGTMVVSYSRNKTDLGEVIADPFKYRPRFLRVRLP